MKKGVKFTALTLAATLMFSYPLCSGITAQAATTPLKTVESSNVPTKYTGLSLSILGDSISTFNDYIPVDYNIYYPGNSGIPMVEGTWWYQVLNATGMRLCSNASSANTNVTGNSVAADGSAPGCSFRRIMDLKGADGTSPDVIIIYMGVNDFARDIPLGSFQSPSIQTRNADHLQQCLRINAAENKEPLSQCVCILLYPFCERPRAEGPRHQ